MASHETINLLNNRSEIGLNIMRKQSYDSLNLRVFELCMSGTFQLVKAHPALSRCFEIGSEIEVFWTLQWNLAFNSGMAFSRGQGFGPVIAVVATVVIVWLLVSLRTSGGKLNTFGIGCVIGGAAGNLIDRVFRQEAWLRGSVVDFIDFQWFPIFNIADFAINVGAAALILNAVLTSRRARHAIPEGDGA